MLHARPAGPKITLHFLYVLVYSFVHRHLSGVE